MERFCTPDEELPDWAKQKTKDDPPPELKSNVYGAVKKTIFIVGITLLVFASARNSITWHPQFSPGTHSFLFEYFWVNSLFFMYLDIFKPAYFMKYKIQEDIKPTMQQLMKAVRVVMRNHFLGFVFSAPFYFLIKWRGQTFKAEELPTFHWVLFEICVYIVVEEIGFYYSHSLMHHRLLYKHIHKIHHEWTAPVSIIGIYAHPVEHFLSNILPVYLGPFIMGSHISCLWLWSCMAISSTQVSHGGYHLPFLPSPEAHDFHHLKLMHHRLLYKHIHKIHHEWTAPVSIIGNYAHPIEHMVSNVIPVFMGPFIMGSHISCLWLWSCMAISSTQVSHGGYHLPFLPSPEAHDFHHLKFTNNFGVMGVLDRFHGTDSTFVKTKAYDRHLMLIGLTPAKVLFPDEEKKGGKKKKSM